ncbi:molybdopterin cofactor-binding domain-containing protein [uncultured Ferrovibrio sp.]|jgi:Aerobic-type carbon monoxide dehydrogenase, large subunit CoxL/CutL homologs|uniref:xanthine dehydrogenase family protein molybdopterin-binding subunit n=1 Tax=uncultured Ferrovibrio sp. TaxID=1576913 RepID=UPI002615DF6B|nr:molybdopterin cofactor-binding domain-containing protein [uncultured Ferrovibrio sp.]
MSATFETTRRAVLAFGAAAAGELLIGFTGKGIVAQAQTPAARDAILQSGTFIRIDRRGQIFLVVPYAEMGQGALAAVAMLVAEELEVSPYAIKTEMAPGDDKLYGHPLLGDQITGGSLGVRGAWKQMRQAGAAARIVLIQAAAQGWSVDPSTCHAQDGYIIHAASGRRAPYGDLVERARALPVPQDPPIRDGNFKVIGKSMRRTDAAEKVNGSALYGIDVRMPGLKYAALMLSPVLGGKLVDVDPAPAMAIRGVSQVVKHPEAIAVVASNTGAARKGLAALSPRWAGGNTTLRTADLVADLDSGTKVAGLVATTGGDSAAAMAKAAKVHQMDFRMPMLAHAAMEPLNCTVHYRQNACEIWVGSQGPGRARKQVAAALGLPEDAVTVHNHHIGGGFGRRLQSEWIVLAAEIGSKVQGPVQICWGREQDFRHDAFRYHNHSAVKVGVDDKGKPVSFEHRVVGPSIMSWFLPAYVRDGVDLDVVNGASGSYEWPNHRVEYVRKDPPAGLLAGNWRGVGETRNCFVVETVVDELAYQAGQDPVQYRRALLKPGSRILHVLDRVAEASKWGSPLPRGSGRGVSVLEGFGSYMAVVAEVELPGSNSLRLKRITAVVDCGQPVNPNIVRQQIEGGLIYGISAALYGRVTIHNGQIQQTNFHDHPVLRMNEMPDMEVIVIDSKEAPGGVGEPGTAVLAPAITNAIKAAGGPRLYSLPIDLTVESRA